MAYFEILMNPSFSSRVGHDLSKTKDENNDDLLFSMRSAGEEGSLDATAVKKKQKKSTGIPMTRAKLNEERFFE